MLFAANIGGASAKFRRIVYKGLHAFQHNADCVEYGIPCVLIIDVPLLFHCCQVIVEICL